MGHWSGNQIKLSKQYAKKVEKVFCSGRLTNRDLKDNFDLESISIIFFYFFIASVKSIFPPFVHQPNCTHLMKWVFLSGLQNLKVPGKWLTRMQIWSKRNLDLCVQYSEKCIIYQKLWLIEDIYLKFSIILLKEAIKLWYPL